ncbi:hypothetical protein N9W62_00025 [Akkermansiaceae bacterium]|nr:hypothetical protein [Akkermansiaceae bacterium]
MSQKKVSKKKAVEKAEKAEIIILGIDVHADRQVVSRQIDGQTPQPAQSFSYDDLMHWVKKQLKLAKKVYTCYEAGPFGYGMHREFERMGVENVVVRPRNWDEYGQKIKTDKRDTRALCEALERYVRGNKKAVSVVRVPSEQEEQKRSAGRYREALSRELQRLAAMGRGQARYYGACLKGRWWGKRQWGVSDVDLPESIRSNC